MKITEVKKPLAERYTHGSSHDNTWFKIMKKTSKHTYWWCTHGYWELKTDLEGKNGVMLHTPIGDVSTDVEIKEVYTKEVYMSLFGNKNPYERG